MVPVMDLPERVARRRAVDDDRLVTAWSSLSPVVHPDSPVGRGAVLERLLDRLEPVFAAELPGDFHVHGPGGTGKSAVVVGLFSELSTQLGGAHAPIRTTTRVNGRDADVEFVCVDARRAASPFRVYRAVLAALRDESVPERGVSTETLRSKLGDELGPHRKLVVALDHLGEPRTPTPARARALFESVDGSVTTVTVSRADDEAVPSLAVPAYRDTMLTEVLMSRGSRGLRGGLAQGTAERIADWANGDASDALSALFGAAMIADHEDMPNLSVRHVRRGTEGVPQDGVPLGRVLTLPENRQAVLDGLLEGGASGSIEAIAGSVSADMDLSAGTVTRFLYELAEDGILQRVEIGENEHGPSGVVPRFPTLVYRKLRS
jgi:Cdc6-like AAA superfamily ATPase